ncbi:MAG TPA: asparagine synthase (glutamine-hydrolyzing) [Polyangia bacterium]|nr:asparagine synthase (glutamine-hydrolyzing) [Polyangia bacterium]
MCGIVAMFSPEEPVTEASLQRMLNTLEHRGPDGRRCWTGASGLVGLGHARLSIIDLEGGTQPLENEDGRVRVVVNGEFYDFERIRADLETRGHRFRTRSDSEIVVHLYEEYGAHCVHHLRGEFAFVLWDDRNQRLLCARDRFGIKPLFYAVHRGALHVASEGKALLAAGVPARWDGESFFQASIMGCVEQDRTMFAGVRQVAPGHYLLATRDCRRVIRYWDFDYPLADDRPSASVGGGGGGEVALDAAADRERAEQFRAVLDEAVRLRLRADVPVGCYLSGGIDSCAVLGLASRHVSRPIRAFTLSFDRPEYDELPIAQEMAAACGAELTPLPISSTDLAQDFGATIWHAEQIILNANSVAKFRLSRAVRGAGYKVVLTGEGSDEILAGYPHFRRDMLLYDRKGQDPGVVEKLLADLAAANVISRGILMPAERTGAGAVTTVPGLEVLRQRLGYIPSFLEATGGAGARARGFLAAAYLASVGAEREPFGALLDSLDVRGQLAGRAPVNQSLYLWSKTALPNFILSVLGDRMEMAHSVEGRLPFLDHHVVESVRELPVNAKIRGTIEKHVLREAARPVITDTVYRRQKHPFLAPPAATALGGPLDELVQQTLRGPALRNTPFYDAKRVIGLLDTLPSLPASERAPLDAGLMVMTSVCLLGELFRLAA